VEKDSGVAQPIRIDDIAQNVTFEVTEDNFWWQDDFSNDQYCTLISRKRG
jgi:hypothetical protein